MVEFIDIFQGVALELGKALGTVGAGFIVGTAQLVVVVLFILLGYLVARLIVSAVNRALEHSNLEGWLEKKGLHDALLGFTVKGLIGTLIKLVTVATFLGIAARTANLGFVEQLVFWFIGYIPSLVQGIVIIAIALLGVDYVTDKITAGKGVPLGRFLATAFKVFVGYTAVVIALPLLLPGADVELLKLAFLLILGAASLALGLGLAIAIGLGLKDTVASLGKKREKEIERLI
ncbi:MAG: hypothetical protein ACE5DI_00155 [Candidatus Micrarchaeia archaeon]